MHEGEEDVLEDGSHRRRIEVVNVEEQEGKIEGMGSIGG